MILLQSSGDEMERLKTLYAYSILDTKTEESYDNLAELASNICEAPIGLISFFDEQREWFKAHYGVSLSEQPRNWLNANNLIGQEEVFEVSNIGNDKSTNAKPIFLEEVEVAYYAGVLLFSSCGKLLGSLYVINNRVSYLNDAQKKQLTLIAKQIVTLLELGKSQNIKAGLYSKFEADSKILTEKNKQLEQFMYTVSHDLKSPLVTLSAFTKTLAKELAKHTTDKQKYRFERIEDNISQMGDLLEELLELSRVMNQELSAELLDIEVIIKKQWQRVVRRVPDLSINFVIESPLEHIFANRSLFTKCIFTLLSNAVQNKNQGKDLEIKVKTQNYDKQVSVSIIDNGIGIADSDQERIFCLFEQVNKNNSTATGLCIVKAVMDKHNGEVKLLSTLETGSQFELLFPVNSIK